MSKRQLSGGFFNLFGFLTRRKGKDWSRWYRQRLLRPAVVSRVESLEDRRMLTSDFVFQATDATPLQLQVSGGQVQIVNKDAPQSVLMSQALAGTTQVIIQGNGNDVQLTLDGSVPSFPNGISFQAGTGKTALFGPNFNNVWTVTGAGAGNLNGVVQFSGVDSIFGGSGNDSYQLLTGNKLGSLTIDEAAGGIDTLDFSAVSNGVTIDLSKAEEQSVNGNLTLTLSSGEIIENVLGGSGADRITGNELDNTIRGGAGNDTLTGGGGDDFYVFSANFGSDSIIEEDGATSGGTDKIDTSGISANTTVRKLNDATYSLTLSGGSIAFNNVEQVAAGSGTNALDYSAAPSAVFVNLTTQFADQFNTVTGFRNVIGSDFNDTIVGNELANVITGGKGNDRLSGQSGSDTIDGGSGFNTLTEVRDGSFVLTNASLTIMTSGSPEIDVLSNIDAATLSGGLGANRLDASSFRPLLATTDIAGLNSGSGVNLAANDLKLRLTDGTTVNVNLSGAVTVQDVLNAIAGAASGKISAVLNADSNAIVVTQTAGNGAGNLSFFSTSSLASDLGLNVTGAGAVLNSLRTVTPGVVLDGGSTVPLSALNSGNGVRTTNLEKLSLLGNESNISLASLNQGSGVRTVGGNDFQITLTDGKTINVDVHSAMTLRQALDAITAAANAVEANRLTVEVDPQYGTSLILKDSKEAGGDLKVTPLNGSLAAQDLGLRVNGLGAKLEGDVIGEISADIRITLTDGTAADIDLTGVVTLNDVITKLKTQGEALSVTVNASGTGLILRDLSNGPGNLRVEGLNNSLAANDLGILGTGTGAVLNGSTIVSGNLRLDGRNDADTLIGSTGDDFLITGGGGDSLTAGAGTDIVGAQRDDNMTLINTSLTFGQGDSATLSGVEQAQLTGGNSANTITATNFTLGAVTVAGGAGNDTLTGGSGDDVLQGGGGADSLDGRAGTDRIVEGGQRVTLNSQGNGVGGAATLDLAEGTNEVATITLGAGVTGGSYQLTFNGETTIELPFDADAFDIKSALAQLTGLDREDLIVGGTGPIGPWTVTFVGVKGGLNVADLTATSVDLVGGGVTATVTTQGTQLLNSLTSIETASLYGTVGNDLIDASLFSGTTLINGTWGNDTLIGGSGADQILGGDDDDRITGNGGVDTLDGEAGIDTIVESRDVNFTLSNVTLTQSGGVLGGGTEVDTIDGFEWAQIAGGNSANTIDLSAFTGLTSDTFLDLLNGGNGFGATNGTEVVLTNSEATTPLSVLNNGAGVRTSAGTDFVLVLRNGQTRAVDLGPATTLKDAFDAIHAAAPRVTATLDATGTAIVLTDTTFGGGSLSVQTPTVTAIDLGLMTTGAGGVLTGLPISDGASDVFVTLSDGTRVGIDLSYSFTLEEALDEFNATNSKLLATLDAGRTRIILTDTAGGGLPITVTAANGSTAGVSLGLIGAGVTNGTASLTGVPIGIAQAAINGGAGNDTLVGTTGDDTFTGGLGGDNIVGGAGTNTLIEQRDANMTLGASSLVIGAETDTLTSIQKAELTGGASANTIDASAFAGAAILSTGGGLDTLKGPHGDATFRVSIDGLTAPTSATDTARQITIHPAAGTSSYEIQKSGSSVGQSDFWWVNTIGSKNNVEYALRGATLNVTEDVSAPATNITIAADRLTINGRTISTASSTDNARNITLRALRINIGGGTVLDARTTAAGKTSGTITIAAVDDKARITGGPLVAQVNRDVLDTRIDIGAASIHGGTVNITAVADSRFVLGNRDFNGAQVSDTGKKIGSIAIQTITEAFPLIAQVSYSRSTADIHLGSAATPAVIVAGTVNVTADTAANIASKPIGLFAAIPVAIMRTYSTINVDNARITTTGDLVIRSKADMQINNVAAVQSIAGIGVGISVSIVHSVATALIGSNAQVTVGRDLFVQSDTIDRNYTNATAFSDLSGIILVGLAVNVTAIDSLAAIDGIAHVGRNVNVTSKVSKQPVEGQKGIFFPSYFNGVSASASIDPNSSFGNPLDDFANSLVAELIVGPIVLRKLGIQAWARRTFGWSPVKDANKFQGSIASSFASYTTNSVARIGDGLTHTPAVVDARGSVNVTSTVDVRPDISASSLVDFVVGDRVLNTIDGPKTLTEKADLDFLILGRPKAVIAVSVATGVYKNSSNALINDDAIVDAGQGIVLDADTRNAFDPSKAYLANLTTAFRKSGPTYSTSSGSKLLKGGDTVEVLPGHTAGGEAAQVYRYIGPDGSQTDLGAENYKDPNRWFEVSLGQETGLGFVRTLVSFIDKNFGLDNNLVDVWTQSAAKGAEKAAVAGSIAVVLLTQNANAQIGGGAQINQKQDVDHPRTGLQTVTVTAHSQNETIDFGGNFQTPGIGIFETGSNFRSWTVNPFKELKTRIKTNSLKRSALTKKPAPGFSSLDGTGGDTKGAVGVTATSFLYRNNVFATINDGAKIFANKLDVTAENKVLGVAIAVSGNKSNDFTFTGVAVVNKVDNTTIARIGGEAIVNVTGDTTVKADDLTNIVTVSGGLARSEKVGLGASLALNLINRRTEAYIGNSVDDSTTRFGGSLTTGGKLSIDAQSNGFIGAFAVAGAAASNDALSRQQTAVAIAAAVASNSVDDATRSYINQATVQSTGGITIAAHADPVFEAFTIGGAVARGNTNSIALAGAASVNSIASDVQAFIKDSNQANGRGVTVTTGALELNATNTTQTFVQAGAVSIAWQSSDRFQKQGRSLSVGVSLAMNLLGSEGNSNSTRAFIDNSTVTARDSIRATAKNDGKSHALAVGGAVSGTSGTAIFPNGVTLVGAAAGAFATNVIYGDVQAEITSGSKVTSQFSEVELSALDHTKLQRADAFGIAVSYASALAPRATVGALSIGVGVSRNKSRNRIQARIDGSTVEALQDVSLIAENRADISLLGVGVAVAVGTGTGTSGAISGAGSAVDNDVDNRIEALISNSNVTTLARAELSATDSSETTLLTGTASGGGASGATSRAAAIAGAASVVLNDVRYTIAATISNTTLTAGSISQTAESEASTLGAAVGFAGSGAIGGKGALAVSLVGAGVVSSISNTILAEIIGGNVTTTSNDLTLSATDNSTWTTVAGAAAGSGAIGGDGPAVSAQLGASFVVNDIDNTIAARIRDGAIVQSKGSVVLTADENLTLTAVALGFAAGGSGSSKLAIQIAGAGSGTGNEISSTIDASVLTSQVTTSAGLNAKAQDKSQITAIAGAIAAGGAGSSKIAVAGSIGLSVAENDIGNHVRAVVDGSKINATQGVTLDAFSDANIVCVTVGGALAVGVGTNAGVAVALGGAGSGNRIHNTIEAVVKGASQVTSSIGGLTLSAKDDADITAVSVGAALAFASGQAAVAVPIGAAVAVNHINNSINAVIADSTITSLGGPLTVSAVNSADINTVAVAATLSITTGSQANVSVSGGGAGAENIILTQTTAAIDRSNVASVPSISVTTDSDSSIDSVITSVGAAGVVGGQAGVGVAIGIGAARNFIGYDKTPNVSANLTSQQRPTSLTFGTTVKATDGPLKNDVFRYVGANVVDGSGIDLSTQNFADARLWEQVNVAPSATGNVARVSDSAISTTGKLTVDAQSHADIDSTVVSVALGVSGGAQAGVGVGVGGAFAINKIKQDVLATVDGAAGINMSAGNVVITAFDYSKIEADTAAGVLSAAFGQGIGVAVAVGLAIATNDIANHVDASIVDADALTTTKGDVEVGAYSRNDIDSLSLAVTVAPAFGKSGVGVAVSGGGATSFNVDLTQTNSAIRNSTVVSVRDVLLTAVNDSDLDSTVVLTSVAAGLGKAVGVGVSIGAATADNYVGYRINGERVGSDVQAIVENSSIDAAGALNLNARSNATIDAEVGAGTLAVAAVMSLYSASVAVSGAGAATTNRIAYDTQALINGDGSGIEAGNISLSASDTSFIDSDVGSVAVSANLALVGASISVGASIAKNLINNDVAAQILNADQTSTTSAGVFMAASELAVVRSHTFAAAASISISIGVGLSNGLTIVENTLTNNVHVNTDGSNITSAGDITMSATDVSFVNALAETAAATVGVVSIAVAASNANNNIGGSVAASVANGTLTSNGSGDIFVTATSQPSISTENTVGAVSVGLGAAVAGGGSHDRVTSKVETRLSNAGVNAVGDDITFAASSTSSVAPKATAFSGSLFVSVGALQSDAVIAGETTSTISGASTINANTMAMAASSTNRATTNAIVASVGLISVSAASSDVDITRTTTAHVAENARVNIGATTLKLNSSSNSSADSSGKSITGGLLSIGAMDIDTNIAATTRSATESGSVILASGGNVDLFANGTSDAHTQMRSVGVGVILNVNASSPSSTVRTTTTAEVFGDILGATPQTNPGYIYVTANSNDRAETKLDSNNGGAINVSVGEVNALSSPITAARIGSNRRVNASGEFALRSTVISEADSSAVGSSGGIVDVSTLNSDAVSTPNAYSEIADGAVVNAGAIRLTSNVPDNRDLNSRLRAQEGGYTPISGDGFTMATSASSSGGLVSVADANSHATNSPSIRNYIGYGAQLAAGDIVLETNSLSAVMALTNGVSGGVVAVGGVDAIVDINNVSQNIIGDEAKLNASNKIAMTSQGSTDSIGKTSANTGGLIAVVSANTVINNRFDVSNRVGGRAELTTLGSLMIDAISNIGTFGNSNADGGGLGVRTTSSNSGGNVGATDNKGVFINGKTAVDIYDNAKLKAGTMRLAGRVAGLYADMFAYSVGEGLGTDSDAVANVDVRDYSGVTIHAGAVVESLGRLDLLADHEATRAQSISKAEGRSAFGDSDSTSITNLLSNSLITTLPGSKIIAKDLNSESKYNVLNYDRRAERSGGIDFGSSRERGNFSPVRNTTWQGDIIINATPLDRKVIINEAGQVEFNRNVSVGASNGVVFGVGGLGITPEDVGSVRFSSNSIGKFDGQPAPGSSLTTSGFFSQSVPTLTFSGTMQSIEVINRGTQTLFFSPIDVVGTATPTVVIDINNISNQGAVFNVERPFLPTTINIQSKGDIFFNGDTSINNPLGSTTISGDIVSFGVIRSHDLAIHSTDSIGTEISGVIDGQPFSRRSGIELTQTSTGSPSLDLRANLTITASITGLQRVNSPFVANVTDVTALFLNVDFNPAKQQFSNGKVGPVLVQKTKPATGLFPIQPFSKYVNSQIFVSIFGFEFDPELFSTDVFGQSNGSQSSATYSVNGRIDANNSGAVGVTIKPNVVVDYLHYQEAASLPNGFAPGKRQEWADLNGDGALDLVTVDGSKFTVLYNELATTNTFRVAQTFDDGALIHSFALGDMDQDGDVDLVFQHRAMVKVYKNVNGTFSSTDTIPLVNPGYSGVFSGGDITLTDVDGDQYLDIIDTGDFAVAIHFVNASGNFKDSRFALGSAFSHVDPGDYDNDGDTDLLLGNAVGSRIYSNDGKGNFTDTGLAFPGTTSGPLQFGDSDGDGDLDVLVLGKPNNGQRTLSIYENNKGDYRLRSETTGAIGDVLWQDHDGDGDLDVLVHYTNPDRNVFLINVGTAANLNDPLFVQTSSRHLPDGVSLQGWSVAPVVGGRGVDLLYAGQQNGQPYYKVLENYQPISASDPPTVPWLTANPVGSVATVYWGIPGGSSTSAPYTYNLRVEHGSDVRTIATPSGRGAISGNSFKISDLAIFSPYQIYVQTVDSSGRRSGWSKAGYFISTNNLVVNQPGDTDDGDPSNNRTTLREAVNFANSEEGPFDIFLAVPQIELEQPLTITNSMSIHGQGREEIIGDGSRRLFNIDDGNSSNTVNVRIEGVALKGGRADVGGAIRSTESLTLREVRFDNNIATKDGGAVWLDIPADGFASIHDTKSGVNQAAENGGLMWINNAGSLFIGGGSITNEAANTKVGNSAGFSGGTFYISNAATGRIETSYYGIMYSQAGMSSSSGQKAGGGVYLANSGRADLTGFTTSASKAEVGGGMAVYNYGAGATATVGGRHTSDRALIGGGVYITNSGGTIITRNMTLDNNTADYSGGALSLFHGSGTTTLDAMYVESNKTLQGEGGALDLQAYDGTLNVTQSLFRGNRAANFGGAINYRGAGTPRTNIVGNTFDTNVSNNRGALFGFVHGGEFNVVENTFSSNSITSTDWSGGSAMSVLAFANTSTNVIANTFAYNDSKISSSSGTVSIVASEESARLLAVNNLVADNVLANGATAFVVSGKNQTLDSNWIGNNVGLLALSFTQGGLVPTHGLAPNSPVIDQGSAPSLLPQFDQRGSGFARAVGRPDIGAFERQAANAEPIVVSTLSDGVDGDTSEGQLSLAEAVRIANARPGANTITFSPNLIGGTIDLRTGSLLYLFQDYTYRIVEDLKIVGPGADQLKVLLPSFTMDDGNPNTQINVEISGLTFKNGALGFLTRENTKLSGIAFESGYINAPLDVGAKLQIENSYFGNTPIAISGAGQVTIDNSTLGTGGVTNASSNAHAGNLIIRNSTLTSAGIVGPATVISSIVPFVGADSVATNSLIMNGDASGLANGPSNTTKISIDTTAPSAPILVTPDSPVTTDSTPVFSGTTEFNSKVVVIVDPDSDATTPNSFTLTTISHDKGNWSVKVPADKALLNGATASYVVTVIDATGNTSAATSGSVQVDNTSPAQPLIILPSLGHAVTIVNHSTPTFRGFAEPGSTVTLNIRPPFVGGFTLTTTAAADGSWSATVPLSSALTETSSFVCYYTLQASDAAGNVSEEVTNAFQVYLTGPSTPTLQNVLLQSTTPEFRGSAAPGVKVTLTIDPDNNSATSNSFVLTTTSDGSGSWVVSVPAERKLIFGNTIKVSAVTTDDRGVNSEVVEATRLITPSFNDQNPAITVPTLTNDPTPRIFGVAYSSSDIDVFVDFDNDPETKNSVKFETQADDGIWSITVPDENAIADGATIGITIIASGVTTRTGSITVDSTAPNAPVSAIPSLFTTTTPTLTGTAEPLSIVRLTIDPYNGTFINYSVTFETTALADGSWSIDVPASVELLNGGRPSYSIHSVDAAGNESSTITGDFLIDQSAPGIPTVYIGTVVTSGTPTLAGVAEPNSLVTLTIDPDNDPGTDNTVTLTTTTSATGYFSIVLTPELADGTIAKVTATATDQAGNVSAASAAKTFQIDRAAPTAPNVTIPSVSTTANPTFSGTAQAGSKVTLSIDPDANSATNNSLVFTTTADGKGNWTVAVPDENAFSNRTFIAVSATATDGAGNISAAISGIMRIATNGADKPYVYVRQAGNDTTPTISGSGTPGMTVRVVVDPDDNSATDNSFTLSTTIDADGSWSVTVPDTKAIADGATASISILSIDANGNIIGSAEQNGIVDPQFGLLNVLGGRIPSMSLRPTSPAIDAGSNPLNLTTDTRGTGFARVTGAAPDMGSTELQPAIFTVTVMEEEDDGDYSPGDLSFREALRLSNLNPGTDTIRFAADLTTIPVALVAPSGLQDYNPLTQQYYPQVAITDSVSIEGRADRSITFTTNTITTAALPFGFGFRTLNALTIDDGRDSKITVRISGATLPNSILSSENLILDNVEFPSDSGNFGFNYLVSSGGLTLANADINGFLTIFATGTGIENSSAEFKAVTINTRVGLYASDVTLTLDQLHINEEDFDYLANNQPPGSSVAFNGLQSNLNNVALTVRDSDYRASVAYHDFNGVRLGNVLGFPSSYVRFRDSNGDPTLDAPNSLVLDNAQINGWAPATIAAGSVTTTEDTIVDIDLRDYAKLSNGDSAGTITGVLNAIGGIVELLSDGFTARFRPDANYNGAASFQYSVTGDPVATPLRPFFL